MRVVVVAVVVVIVVVIIISIWPGNFYVDQAGLEVMEICLPLPPKSWDYRHAPSLLAYFAF